MDRADFVYEIMLDAGTISQHELTHLVQEFFECEKWLSAGSIVSDSLAVLQERGMIAFTGEKVATRNTSRRCSPVWEVVEAAGTTIDLSCDGTTTVQL